MEKRDSKEPRREKFTSPSSVAECQEILTVYYTTYNILLIHELIMSYNNLRYDLSATVFHRKCRCGFTFLIHHGQLH